MHSKMVMKNHSRSYETLSIFLLSKFEKTTHNKVHFEIKTRIRFVEREALGSEKKTVYQAVTRERRDQQKLNFHRLLNQPKFLVD